MAITMKELKLSMNASRNMLKGYCVNGIRCTGWHQINDEVIEFRQEDGQLVRFNVKDVEEIGTCRNYKDRFGCVIPYRNVVLKA